MKILIVTLGLLLVGCAHAPMAETPKTAEYKPIPCDKNSCGKLTQWEIL